MSLIKIPKKLTYSTIKIQVEDGVKNDLENYIKYLDSIGETEGLDKGEKESLVVQEIIKSMLSKDSEFKKWLKEYSTVDNSKSTAAKEQ